MDIQQLIEIDRQWLLDWNGSDSLFWDGLMWVVSDTKTWLAAAAMLLYIIFKNNKLLHALFILVMIGLSSCNKQIKYGVQYNVSKKEILPVKIKLTPQGIKLYEKIYLYRPEYDSHEGDIYTFLGPYEQILHYFKRFGDDAIILEPENLRIAMRNFYYFANKAYKLIEKPKD